MTEPVPPTRRPNRLARESSPYLLQHAHNPVDWFAWGPEAFEEARRREVPIFLSVGYSTCYWCHVMERESFEDEGIGRHMSERFVCVKVDREERPDVDDAYMAAVQIMTGHGGWPMSCFLEPVGLRPFWCGTYFPPEPARGMPGFRQVLEGMSRAWREQRAEVLAQAEAVAESVRRHLSERRAPAAVGVQDVGEAAQTLLRTLDRVHGGFGGAPKFPQPVFLDLLLDTRDHAGDDATRSAVDHAIRLTLDRMALGGVRDQIAGGFHRYSVDATWTVPHFEKMLYDNAQLLATYARAARTYGDLFYARVAREIVEDVFDSLSAAGVPAGASGFFCALDAEVDGREGLNYVWTGDEVRAALSGEDAEAAVRVFGLDRGPNFRDPHHPDAPAASVLVLADRPERLADVLGAEVGSRLDRLRAALLAARRRRKQPRTDDKVLAAWNGLMIAALARSAALLRETMDTSAWLSAAERAAEFLLGRHVVSGELLRASRAVAGGGAHTPGFLEDYALVIQGLVELDAAGSARGREWLAAGRALAERAATLFRDADGVWFDARAGQDDLFVRPRSTHDGAIPSAGSSMVHALLGLGERTGEARWREMALEGLASLSGAIAESPVGAANAARAIVRAVALWPEATEGLASAGAAQGEAGGHGRAREPEQPVEVYADRDRVLVGEEMPAEVTLSLRIAPGYHITSADPGAGGQGLSPLVIGVVGGTGLAVYADFPKGEPLVEGGPMVHTGAVEIRVALERQGEWTGRPMLVVQYQACTETECLLPTAVELAVAIDRG
ncbi:MAG: thioredoxin domain-containing protein [Phycisphaerae bacterium]|nr:thioredoxin domain-containing protein [Phycisphaerae bacterium]